MVMSNSMEEFVVEGVLVMIVGTIGMLLNIIRYKDKTIFSVTGSRTRYFYINLTIFFSTTFFAHLKQQKNFWSELARDFSNFLAPGPSWSCISSFFPVVDF